MNPKLIPADTFSSLVSIPVLGKETVDISITFKYFDNDKVDAMMKKAGSPEKFILDVVTGWDDEEAGEKFSAAALEGLAKKNGAAARAMQAAYVEAALWGRTKN